MKSHVMCIPEIKKTTNPRAKRNLNMKLALEFTFKRELKAYFNSIIKKFAKKYKKNGIILSPEEYKPFTQALLKKHYFRVARKFGKEFRVNKTLFNNIETKNDDDNEDIINEVITATLIAKIALMSNQQGIVLDNTTNKVILEAVERAKVVAFSEGLPMTNEVISALAVQKLKTNFSGRVSTIALTETQVSAETFKRLESAVISRGGNVSPVEISTGEVEPNSESVKEWNAILDARVRNPHAVADGQVKNINDPFIVDGERLMFPGDSSLGASAGNYINCRCSALYSKI